MLKFNDTETRELNRTKLQARLFCFILYRLKLVIVVLYHFKVSPKSLSRIGRGQREILLHQTIDHLNPKRINRKLKQKRKKSKEASVQITIIEALDYRGEKPLGFNFSVLLKTSSFSTLNITKATRNQRQNQSNWKSFISAHCHLHCIKTQNVIRGKSRKQ